MDTLLSIVSDNLDTNVDIVYIVGYYSILLMKPYMLDRYHISFSTQRTTISLDTYLSDLLAIKLKTEPRTLEAHQVVREWLQETIVERLGDDKAKHQRINASQWARFYVTIELLDTKLSKRYWDWCSGPPNLLG